MGKHHYFMVSQQVFADPALCEVAELVGRDAYLLWFWLLAQAKQAQHSGELECSAAQFRRDTGTPSEWPFDEALESMQSQQLIDFEPVPNTAKYVVEITRWDKWQAATSTERVRKHRTTKALQNETEGKRRGNGGETQTDTDTDIDTFPSGKDVKRPVAASPSPAEPDPLNPHGAPRPPKTPKWVQQVWLYYLQATKRSEHEGTVSILTPKRVRMMQARKREGYTERQMCEAVKGFAGSDFHNGTHEKTGGRRYDDYDRIFRAGERIELGISLLREQESGGNRRTASGDSAKIDMAAIEAATRQAIEGKQA